MEDLAHMGSRCHICLLEYPSSGNTRTHLSVALVMDLNSVVCVKGGDGGRPGPHGEQLPHLSAGVFLLGQHTHTHLSVALVMDLNSVVV